MPRSLLPPPEHPTLPSEVRQIYIEVDRKCGTFIFPKLHQLGQDEVVGALAERGAALAERATAGDHPTLEADYRALLSDAQRALREARTVEVAEAADRQRTASARSQLAARVGDAKGRLPAARWARVQQQLAALPDGPDGVADQLELLSRALQDVDQQQRSRQDREAARLASQAESVVRPRQAESPRSRRARRDQAALLAQMEMAPALPATRPHPRTDGAHRPAAPPAPALDLPAPDVSAPDVPAPVPVRD